MGKAKVKPSLVELAKQLPVGPNRKTWFDHLPADDSRRLSELKAAYHKNDLAGHSVSSLHRLCQEKIKLKIKRQAFENWLTQP